MSQCGDHKPGTHRPQVDKSGVVIEMGKKSKKLI